MPPVRPVISCIIIGKESLAYECANRLLNNPDYALLAIVSTDPKLQQLAQEHKTAYFSDLTDWVASKKHGDFDYLFSISNQIVLPFSILKLARRAAINFHDSLLPRYAGLHATSWALLNREVTHGVTWHLMSEGIDTGDILKQRKIKIAPHDTALVLNMKCYEMALTLFEELIEDLKKVFLIAEPQNLSQRSYYPYTKKPTLHGLLNFNNSSDTLYREWRALYFGHHANDYASCKILVLPHCFIVHQMQTAPRIGLHKPGHIITLGQDHIRIATKTDDILVTDLRTLQGQPCSVANFKKITKLVEGDRLSAPKKKLINELDATVNQVFLHEQFWVQQWQSISSTQFPYFTDSSKKLNYSCTLTLTTSDVTKVSTAKLDWELSLITLIAIYIFRLTNKNNLSIGIENNLNSEVALFFANTLPLNVTIQPNSSFLEIYEQISDQKKRIDDHRTPLVDISYRYPQLQDTAIISHAAFPCVIRRKNAADIPPQEIVSAPQFHLILDDKKKECTLQLLTSATQDIKPKILLQRIHNHLKELILSLKKDFDSPIIELNYITDLEKISLLPFPTRTKQDHLSLSVIDHFRQQVKRTPNHISVVYNGSPLTYKEIDNYTSQLADYIKNKVQKQRRNIALILGQSDTAIISMIAILKANCVYVPLNPENPKQRLQHILNDINAALILTDQQHMAEAINAAEDLAIPIIDAEDRTMLKACVIGKNSIEKAHPDDPAYILYTSGSTGNPKGVKIPNKAIIRLVKEQNYVHFQENDKVAQFTTLIFDVSTFEIWGALLNGSKLVIIDKKLGLEPNILRNTIRNECTILFMTPAVFVEVFKSKPDTFDKLRLLILGGEALRAEDVRGLLKRKKQLNLNLTIMNGYGPTENTTWSTYYTIEKLKPGRIGVPIGKAIAFTDTYILDQYCNLLPEGVPGELYLGGVGLASGYLNQSRLTQKSFVKNPYSINKNEKLYKTGDIVKLLPSGDILFLNRIDDQIKIKGIRVELGEIENRLLKHPSVKQGVVIAKNTESKRNYLIAYIAPKNNSFCLNTIQNYLSQYLPDYMIPLKYVILDKLPLTTNRKIDKCRLPEPEAIDASNYKAPRNEKEQLLVKVWSHALRIKHIGRDDNFFALGGDSIIAMQIITKVHQEGWKIKASDIFHNPVIARLANRMKPLATNTRTAEDQEFSVGSIALTPIQTWFINIDRDVNSHFSQFVLLKLRFEPNTSIIEKSFDALIKHHDLLRASFSQADGTWEQIIKNEESPFKIYHDKFSSKKTQSKITEIETKVLRNYANFDLSKPPLIKAVLFNDSKDYYLTIIAHHLVIDGVSWRIFLDDFFMAYHTYTNNKTIALPMKSSSFKSWSDHIRKHSQSSALTNELAYWQRQTNDLELPIDFKRGENTEKYAKVIHSEMDLAKTSLTFKQVSPKDILTTALAITLSHWENQSDVNFYMESHGRESFENSLDLSRTIGWMTSLFPIKISLDSPSEKINYLRTLINVRKKLNAIPLHGIGFGLLKYSSEDLKIKRAMNEISTASLCFNFFGNFDAGISIADMEFVGQPIRLANGSSYKRPHLIDLTAWIKNDMLHIEWKFSKNFHKSSTIQNLSQQYIRNINAIIAECVNFIPQTLVSTDFPFVSLSQEQLNTCINRYPNLENITQLSSLQSGLLFHKLQHPNNHLYHTQLTWLDSRGLDLAIFKKAWETIIKRHSIFRSIFLWKHLDNPIQLTDSLSHLPWKTYDCSKLPKKEQETMTQAIMREDQERHFDFTEHPLMRISVVKKNPKTSIIIWTHHHILLGGWSINTVLSELYSIYEAYKSQKTYDLPPSVPFSDFITYQNQNFDPKQSRRFWTKYLDGFTGTPLFRDFSSESEGTYPEFRKSEFSLPDQLRSKLQKFSTSNNVSLNTTMLYAWSLIISRYTNSRDIGVGIVISTKPNDTFNFESIAGPLINTLPFRHTLKQNDTTEQALKKINENVLNISQNCHTPLIDIYSWLKRNTQDVLFNTLFAFENYPLTFPDKKISGIKINDVTHYPLVLSVYPHDIIRLTITYNAKIFDVSIIENMLSSYCETLSEILENPYHTMANFKILSHNELKTLQAGWNYHKSHYPKATIPSLIHQIAEKNPHKTAITCIDKTISYRELDLISNRWANYLLKNNCNHGAAVGIFVDRSIEMITAILATLKAGCTYVPIDPSFPLERISSIFSDVKIKVIFTDSSLLNKLDSNLRMISVNIRDFRLLLKSPKTAPSITTSTSDAAYVIYTSGSSGHPKGIQIKHNSIINAIYSCFKELNLTQADRLLSFTSIAFDISALEIFGPLIWGMELEIASSDLIKNPSLLSNTLNARPPSVIQSTPSFLQMLINADWLPTKGLKILCGGEVLAQPLADTLLQNGAFLWNAYGPTETTIWSTLSRVSPNKPIDIGKPISNTEIYILDDQQQASPTGITGELYIGGDGLALGYINRPELNEAKFIPHPFSKSKSKRLYRTGDLAMWMPNGNLRYIDRSDDQIKVRGYRVELEEVRAVILKHPSITDCAVVKAGNTYDDAHLVAFYTTKAVTSTLNNDDLNQLISTYLPPYMRPDTYINLPNFTLNSSGKIDKKMLLNLYNSQRQSKLMPAANPANPTEKMILNIFAKVLGIKNLQLNNNFFELGGNSVSAIQILSSIQESFSISMSMSDVLTMPTPRELSNAIVHRRFSSSDTYDHIPSPIIPLQTKGGRSPLFLIHPVGGTIFWFIKLANLLGKDQPVYGIQDPALLTNTAHFSSFENMASFYVKEIKKIQSDGPYFIAGASFGANMAYEVAKQLLAERKTVSFVGLLDGWGIYPNRVSTLDFLKKEMKSQYKEIKDKHPEINMMDIKPIIDIAWHRSHLLSAYPIDWIDIPLTLFKAENTLDIFSSIESPNNHWADSTPHLNIVSVPGTHESMFFEPNVEILAKKLKDAMSQVHREIGSSNLPDSDSGAALKALLPHPNTTAITLFEHITDRDHNGFAVVFNGRCMTYEKLNNCANQLAHYLIDADITTGDIVGVHLDHDIEMVIAILGILKSGAAYAPLHYSDPKQTNAALVSCRAVISQKNIVTKFDTLDNKMIFIDRDWQFIRHKSTNNPGVTTDLDDAAIILSPTSSKQNTPNLIITHRCITNLVQWSHTVFSKDELSGVLASTSLSNELFLFELFPALCYGGAIHLVKNIENLADIPFSGNATFLSTTPEHLRLLLKTKKLPKSLQVIILHTRSIDNYLLLNIHESTNVGKVFNAYVKNEQGLLTPGLMPRNIRNIPNVGKPIPNAKIILLQNDIQSIPLNSPLEPTRNGDVLCLGYLNSSAFITEDLLSNPNKYLALTHEP